MHRTTSLRYYLALIGAFISCRCMGALEFPRGTALIEGIYIITEGDLLSRPALDRPTIGPTMDGCPLTEEAGN